MTDESFDAAHWRELKEKGKYREASEYVMDHINNNPDTKDFKAILVELAERMLREAGKPNTSFSNILIHGLTIHADEPNGTTHLDIRYTIFTNEGNVRRTNGRHNGLATRVSMNKGLSAMGFISSKESTALNKYRDWIKKEVEQLMLARGYQRDIIGEHRKHEPTEIYAMRKEGERLEAQLDELQSKLEAAEKTIKDANEAELDLEMKRTHHKHEEQKLSDREEKLKQEQQAVNDLHDKLKSQAEQIRQAFVSIKVLKEKQEEHEKEFQRREDSLEAQKLALQKREETLDAQSSVSSPSGAANYLLSFLSDKHKGIREDQQALRYIKMLQSTIKQNSGLLDKRYGEYIQEIKRKRAEIRGLADDGNSIAKDRKEDGIDFSN